MNTLLLRFEKYIGREKKDVTMIGFKKCPKIEQMSLYRRTDSKVSTPMLVYQRRWDAALEKCLNFPSKMPQILLFKAVSRDNNPNSRTLGKIDKAGKQKLS